MATISVLSFDPARMNCGIITGPDRSLIVDTGPGPSAAARLAERATDLSRAADGVAGPIDVVITHDHWDHHLGAATLVAAGIERVFASTSFAADQEGSTWIALDDLRKFPGTADLAAELPEDPGDLIVDVTPIAEAGEVPTTVDLGDCPVEFHVLGGHSTADVVVRVREAGVVFTGDLVEENDPPQAGGDASLSQWARSLRTLLSFPEATTFVPGHGAPVDRAFVQRQLEDIDELRTRQDGAEVTLPSRAMPGDHDRTIPREIALPLS